MSNLFGGIRESYFEVPLRPWLKFCLPITHSLRLLRPSLPPRPRPTTSSHLTPLGRPSARQADSRPYKPPRTVKQTL